MAADLYRIDERLLHGQVIVGWGMRLGLTRYVVVDDDLAHSEWEQDLYASGLPPEAEVDFVGVEEGIRRLRELLPGDGTGAVLTRSTSAMRRLAESGLLDTFRVNVGGLHEAAGRRRVLRYVSLRDDEVDDLEAIAALGVPVTARDLPTSREVPLQELVHGAG